MFDLDVLNKSRVSFPTKTAQGTRTNYYPIAPRSPQNGDHRLKFNYKAPDTAVAPLKQTKTSSINSGSFASPVFSKFNNEFRQVTPPQNTIKRPQPRKNDSHTSTVRKESRGDKSEVSSFHKSVLEIQPRLEVVEPRLESVKT